MSDRLDMARQALEQAEKDTENWPGPCHKCKHWRQWMAFQGVSDWDYCANDLARLKTFSAHGGYDVKLPECRIVRSKAGLCGPEGRLFEAKPTVKGFFARIFGR